METCERLEESGRGPVSLRTGTCGHLLPRQGNQCHQHKCHSSDSHQIQGWPDRDESEFVNIRQPAMRIDKVNDGDSGHNKRRHQAG